MKIRSGFISNSSSSSFIFKSKLSVKEIDAILQEMLDFYNKIFEKKLEFYDVFGYTTKLTQETIFERNKNYSHQLDEDDVGSIEIYGHHNSIPNILQEMIVEKFDAYSCRL